MIMQITDMLLDRNIQIGALATVAAAASVLSVVAPMFQKDPLKERMQNVNNYKEDLRKKHRESVNAKPGNLRTTADKGVAKQLVEQFKLLDFFDANAAAKKLAMAGKRGERPVITYMISRVLSPVLLGLGGILYIYVLEAVEASSFMKMVYCGGALVLGFFLPNILLTNAITKRREAIQLAFPDALDLLLICVEAGMSIEAAFQKVGEEVGASAPELAEELGLTTAELSYLAERKQAYHNLGERTGLESVKSVTTALIQSETYGTPLGASLRVMAAENRELRMQNAEKKAAALPPKLTVPMILFNLPVLFVVILTSAILRVMGFAE